MTKDAPLHLPSVDQVLKTEAAEEAIGRYGRPAAVGAIRGVLQTSRAALSGGSGDVADASSVAKAAVAALIASDRPNVRAVFNLTGTVLHTNLGRAVLAQAAIDAGGNGYARSRRARVRS